MYRIRLMEPRDVPAIQKLHDAQNKRDGTNYPLTKVFDESWRRRWHVPLGLTVLSGEEVRQGAAFECSAGIQPSAPAVEMMLSGCDPKATAQLHKEIRSAFYLLRSMGFEVVHCFIPKDVVIPVEKPLKDVGFVRDDGKFAHFMKELTEDEPDEAPEGK